MRQKLSIEIMRVRDLIGRDKKMTSDYKFIMCLNRSPWHVVIDFSIQFLLTCFKWLTYCVIRQKLLKDVKGVTALLGNDGKET